MSRPISIVLIGWALFSPSGAGQLGDLGAERDAAIVERLEYLASGEWHPPEKDPAWLDLLRALNEELTRKPQSRLSAAAREAAARVDVEITPIIARRNDDLSVQVDVRQRFVLDMAIPYVAEVYASLDGGAWFRVGVFRDGHGCGTRLTATDFWPTKLADGIHFSRRYPRTRQFDRYLVNDDAAVGMDSRQHRRDACERNPSTRPVFATSRRRARK